MWPGERGDISKNANQFSPSATRWHGISPATIFSNNVAPPIDLGEEVQPFEVHTANGGDLMIQIGGNNQFPEEVLRIASCPTSPSWSTVI